MLESMGSQRVRHDLAIECACTHTHLDNTVLWKGHRFWNQIVLGPTLPVLFLSWVIMEGY